MKLKGNIKRLALALGLAALSVFIPYQYITNWRHTAIVRLQRTGCFGFCPTYELTIFENGIVQYDGHEYVASIGKRKASIGEARVRQLVADLNAAGYFSFQDSYDDQYASDHPYAITYVKMGRIEKRINHYLGSRNAPEELYRLEKTIDDAANSVQWVKGSAPNSGGDPH